MEKEFEVKKNGLIQFIIENFHSTFGKCIETTLTLSVCIGRFSEEKVASVVTFHCFTQICANALIIFLCFIETVSRSENIQHQDLKKETFEKVSQKI